MVKIIFLLGVLILINGCNDDRRMASTKTSNIEDGNPIVCGDQKISFVDYNGFENWVKSHPKIKIISITSVDRELHGYTSSVIVVYKEGE